MLEKLLAARGVERRDICARHLYYANTVTQDAHRPPCARHPAQTAQSNALVTAYRESRDRGVRMSVRVHTHMCLKSNGWQPLDFKLFWYPILNPVDRFSGSLYINAATWQRHVRPNIGPKSNGWQPLDPEVLLVSNSCFFGSLF